MIRIRCINPERDIVLRTCTICKTGQSQSACDTKSTDNSRSFRREHLLKDLSDEIYHPNEGVQNVKNSEPAALLQPANFGFLLARYVVHTIRTGKACRAVMCLCVSKKVLKTPHLIITLLGVLIKFEA